MSWVAAFVASWYSIAYALGGVLLLYVSWWISTLNIKISLGFNRGIVILKSIAIISLILMSSSLFLGAYQVTAFTHYFSTKKMPSS